MSHDPRVSPRPGDRICTTDGRMREVFQLMGWLVVFVEDETVRVLPLDVWRQTSMWDRPLEEAALA